jgi:hypothetical protein
VEGSAYAARDRLYSRWVACPYVGAASSGNRTRPASRGRVRGEDGVEDVSTARIARRSDEWFHDPDMYGFVRRAFAKSMGLDNADLARPIIGIAQTHSELNAPRRCSSAT